MKSIKHKTRCWSCGNERDRMNDTYGDGYAPKDGDLLFCMNCGCFAVIDSTFVDGVRKPTPAENFEIKCDKNLQKLVLIWHVTMRKED